MNLDLVDYGISDYGDLGYSTSEDDIITPQNFTLQYPGYKLISSIGSGHFGKVWFCIVRCAAQGKFLVQCQLNSHLGLLHLHTFPNNNEIIRFLASSLQISSESLHFCLQSMYLSLV